MGNNAMSKNPGMPLNPGVESATTTCLNCHAPMPSELRFCRNCGFRLGEGSAEYTQTVRFQNGQSVATASTGTAQPLASAPAGSPVLSARGCKAIKQRKRVNGMTWIFLALLLFFIGAGAFTAIVTPVRRAVNREIVKAAPARSWVGVDSFDTTDGGVTFDNVEPPGSPADKAGLVGGDIITSFDGHPINSDDQIMELLGQTPIGKTVEVIYIRDGETQTTKLTTIAKEEFDRLGKAFRTRPEGRGRFGYDNDDAERVQISENKMFGVRLGDISASLPADMAGIKKGDIVIEFDSVPIRTPEELNSRIQRAVPYTTVPVVVMRGAERLEIPVKMGRQ